MKSTILCILWYGSCNKRGFLCFTLLEIIPILAIAEAISALLITPAFSTSSAGDIQLQAPSFLHLREFSGWKSSNSWSAGSVSSQQLSASDCCSINPLASQILSYLWDEYLHWFSEFLFGLQFSGNSLENDSFIGHLSFPMSLLHSLPVFHGITPKIKHYT